MVYLAKKGGIVVHHTSKDAMLELDGISKPDMEVTDAEFEAAGGLARIVNGQIFLGKTDGEKAADTARARIAQIDHELTELNQRQTRSSAEITNALAHSEEPPEESVAYHDQRENTAAALREERRQLEQQINTAA